MILSFSYHLLCGILIVIINLAFRRQNIKRNYGCAGEGINILHTWDMRFCSPFWGQEEQLVIHIIHKCSNYQ